MYTCIHVVKFGVCFNNPQHSKDAATLIRRKWALTRELGIKGASSNIIVAGVKF